MNGTFQTVTIQQIYPDLHSQSPAELLAKITNSATTIQTQAQSDFNHVFDPHAFPNFVASTHRHWQITVSTFENNVNKRELRGFAFSIRDLSQAYVAAPSHGVAPPASGLAMLGIALALIDIIILELHTNLDRDQLTVYDALALKILIWCVDTLATRGRRYLGLGGRPPDGSGPPDGLSEEVVMNELARFAASLTRGGTVGSTFQYLMTDRQFKQWATKQPTLVQPGPSTEDAESGTAGEARLVR